MKGIEMSKESLLDHLKAFQDVEDSIKELEEKELKKNPKSKYMKMVQQKLDFGD